jgi:hypothetical protein
MTNKTYWVVEDEIGNTPHYWNGVGLWTAANNPETEVWTKDIHEARKFDTKEECEECAETAMIQGTVTEHMDIDKTTTT